MSKPLVSVLMAVYKEDSEFLAAAAASILAQTYVAIELVIVYDDPEGGHLAWLRALSDKYCNVKLHQNTRNIGLAASLNIAIDMASGEYVARMDADDISLPERIYKQFLFLTENDYDLVGCGIRRFSSSVEDGVDAKLPSDPSQLKRLLPYVTIAFHPTWFAKKEVFDLCRYDNSLPAGQDYDLICRLVEREIAVSNVQNVLLNYRVHSDSTSFTKELEQIAVHWYVNHREGYESWSACASDICTPKELAFYQRGFLVLHEFLNSRGSKLLPKLLFYILKSRLLRYKALCMLKGKYVSMTR